MIATQLLVELQDKVLEFLLRYREEKEPELRFMLRTSNKDAALDEGNWFPTSRLEGGYYDSTYPVHNCLQIEFWSGSLIIFTVLDRGKPILQINLPEVSMDIENQIEPIRKLLSNSRYGKGGMNANPIIELEYFLKEVYREISQIILQQPATIDPKTGKTRGLRMLDETEFQSMLRTVLEFREKRKKSSLLPSIKPSKPKSGEMPVALESLVVRNFQGIGKTELIGLRRAPWIFLTGNNGYGKSCLLRAIFIGFYGKRDGDTELANGGTDIVLRYWDEEKVITNSSNEAQSPSIAAYGPHRLEITDEISKEQRTDRSSASFSLFKTSAHLLNVEGYLRDWYTDPKRKSRYTTVIEMFKILMPGIGDISFDEDSRRILYCEKDAETGDNLPSLDFLKLASGFKSIIAFVGDMCIRFFESNPSWSAPHDFKGIVIIDELDLHMHPIWQRQLPALLSKAFPKIQFIVSTHSPIPILGAPKGSIFFKVDRTKEEGITVERLDIDVSTLLPNTILTSPIFGFQEIFAETFNDKSQRVNTETTYEGKVLNDILDKELLELARKSDKAQKLLSYSQQS